MLATSQLGITICSLLILNVSEPAIHHLLAGPARTHRHVRGAPSTSIAFIVALVVVSYLHVVFGEMVPKNLAFSVPDRAVLHARDAAGVGVEGLPPGDRGPQLDREQRPCGCSGSSPRTRPRRPSRSRRSRRSSTSRASRACSTTPRARWPRPSSSPTRRRRTSRCPLADLVTLREHGDARRDRARRRQARLLALRDRRRRRRPARLRAPQGRAAGGGGAGCRDRRSRVRSRRSASTHGARARDHRPRGRPRRSCAAPGGTSRRCATTTGRTTAVLFLEDIIEELIGEVQDATRRGRR